MLVECVIVARGLQALAQLVPKERDWSADMTSTSSSRLKGVRHPGGRRQDGVKQEVSIWATLHKIAHATSIKLPKEEQICKKRLIQYKLFVDA